MNEFVYKIVDENEFNWVLNSVKWIKNGKRYLKSSEIWSNSLASNPIYPVYVHIKNNKVVGWNYPDIFSEYLNFEIKDVKVELRKEKLKLLNDLDENKI